MVLPRRLVIAATLALAACSRSDASLNDEVEARLAGEPTPLEQLEVTTRARIVTVSGVVATPGERERVERIVRDVDGVLAVDNRLTVLRPVHATAGESATAFNPEDRAIRDAVQERLREAGISGIDVEVTSRVVRLHGEVERGRHVEAVRVAREAGTAARADRVEDELVIR